MYLFLKKKIFVNILFGFFKILLQIIYDHFLMKRQKSYKDIKAKHERFPLNLAPDLPTLLFPPKQTGSFLFKCRGSFKPFIFKFFSIKCLFVICDYFLCYTFSNLPALIGQQDSPRFRQLSHAAFSGVGKSCFFCQLCPFIWQSAAQTGTKFTKPTISSSWSSTDRLHC